jgi:hypothetical protein
MEREVRYCTPDDGTRFASSNTKLSTPNRLLNSFLTTRNAEGT